MRRYEDIPYTVLNYLHLRTIKEQYKFKTKLICTGT